jgi:plastocyanin
MRPLFRVLRAAAALAGAGALLTLPGPAHAANATVTANAQNTFSPATVTIDAGDTVTWQYGGGLNHTVTSKSTNWQHNTPLGPPSLTAQTSETFKVPGTYTYVCTTHEAQGMRGTIVVRGTSPTKPPRPTRTRTPAPPPTHATRPPSAPPSSASATPTPSAGSATPVVPDSSAAPTPSLTPPPAPTVAPPLGTPGDGQGAVIGTPYLRTDGLTAPPPTGREKGLPVLLALLLVGGVGSAELRALLAVAPPE